MITVQTKNAVYVVDRQKTRWKRISIADPRSNDGEWVAGGFTLGEVGQPCFAHYANDPRGALGRSTSRVISIKEES